MDADEFKIAIRSTDRRTQLEALRDHLATELADPRAGMAIAPISKELREVLAELAAMEPPKGDARVVDLTARIAGIKTAASQGSQAV